MDNTLLFSLKKIIIIKKKNRKMKLLFNDWFCEIGTMLLFNRFWFKIWVRTRKVSGPFPSKRLIANKVDLTQPLPQVGGSPASRSKDGWPSWPGLPYAICTHDAFSVEKNFHFCFVFLATKETAATRPEFARPRGMFPFMCNISAGVFRGVDKLQIRTAVRKI